MLAVQLQAHTKHTCTGKLNARFKERPACAGLLFRPSSQICSGLPPNHNCSMTGMCWLLVQPNCVTVLTRSSWLADKLKGLHNTAAP